MPVRQRQEVQKMLRRLITPPTPIPGSTGILACVGFGFFLAASLSAAILPDHLGPHTKASSSPIETQQNQQLWSEYGFVFSERATYGPFRLTAWQMKDPTGAFAAAQWLKSTDPAATVLGNYVYSCSGKCPPAAQLQTWLSSLPNLSRASYPNLDAHLPAKDLVPGSKRYILGPVSLAEFEPRIPAGAVGFDFSPEAQLAKFKTPKGDTVSLALFSYPTPGIARQQATTLAKLPDSVVKRAGPIVAVALAPGDKAGADRLLSQIGYAATVSTDDQPLPLVLTPRSAGEMILAICTLAGIVLGFCLLSGLIFAGFRILSRKFGYSDAATSYTTLHLSDKITPRVSPR